MTVITENQHHQVPLTGDERPGPDLIGWGAIIAGLVLMVGISWLMLLLGSAIGVSIADATDLDAIGKGLGVGAVIWMILTALVSYFFGGWLAAWLSGKTPTVIGMLHGMTVWSAGTLLVILLGYAGVAGLVNTGQAVFSGTAITSAVVASTATADTEDGTNESANSSIVAQLQAQLKRQVILFIAQAEAASGADVSPEEVREMMEQLDAQALQAVAVQLLQGNTEAAKAVLAVNTNLSQAEVNEIVEGIKQYVQQLQAEVRQRIEVASSYTQAVLWVAFASSFLGLIVAILGGWVGAKGVRHFYATHPRVPMSNRAGP